MTTTLPLVDTVDVLIFGGSSGAVAAALAAHREGARVLLLCPRPYLGADITALGRFWRESRDSAPGGPLEGVWEAEEPPTTPGNSSSTPS